MRVIKQCEIPERLYVGTCSNCKTEIEAEFSEVWYFSAVDQRDSGTISKCPACGKKVYMRQKS